MFVECHQLNLYHGRASTFPELLGRREPSRHNKLCAPTTERLLLILVPTYEQSEDRGSFGQPSARYPAILSTEYCDTCH
ncbi:hypothetical protein ALC57_04827 [Trachymyrmex cornetzi]|uniref:Uncharacterized protein n=1 Tax=Trachymyrmex cornetzi TaxID=471704 RepID=A0A195ECV7_9HYME|nr:hypothetical protein ALC57_04827 [Trachymyrmex cornetzi]